MRMGMVPVVIAAAVVIGPAVAIGAIVNADPPAAPRAESSRPLAERVAERVQREMREKGLVGVSVGLVRDGEVIFTGGWGMADREHDIPVTDDTVYVWASCSKTLTAVVAMRLWGEGKLDLEKDVRAYVPEWPAKQWKGREVVLTPRLLLCHESGLPHSQPSPRSAEPGAAAPDDAGKEAATHEHPYKDVVACLDQFKDVPLKSRPGSAFSYSNCGFILLGAVEQRAGGESYADLVRHRIAEPLGLKSLRPHASWDPAPHLAQGYAAGGKRPSHLPSSDVRYGLPAGFWSSTIHDFALYAAGLMGDKLLDARMRAAMWHNQKTADGRSTPVGLGIFVGGQRRGRVILNHSGGSAITSTYMVIAPGTKPGQGEAVVIMCNTAGAKPGQLGNDLLRMLEGDGAGGDIREEPRSGHSAGPESPE
jgi:CubicO group peptidase (beta-lactamase class C family)